MTPSHWSGTHLQPPSDGTVVVLDRRARYGRPPLPPQASDTISTDSVVQTSVRIVSDDTTIPGWHLQLNTYVSVISRSIPYRSSVTAKPCQGHGYLKNISRRPTDMRLPRFNQNCKLHFSIIITCGCVSHTGW